jgi:hypothetical protein
MTREMHTNLGSRIARFVADPSLVRLDATGYSDSTRPRWRFEAILVLFSGMLPHNPTVRYPSSMA